MADSQQTTLRCSSFNGCLVAKHKAQSRRVVTRFSVATLILSSALSRAHHTTHSTPRLDTSTRHQRAPDRARHCSSPARSLSEWHAMWLRVLADTSAQARSIMCGLPVSPSPPSYMVNAPPGYYSLCRPSRDRPSRRRVKAPRRMWPKAFAGAQDDYIPHLRIIDAYGPIARSTHLLNRTQLSQTYFPSLSDRYPGVACSEALCESVSSCLSRCLRDPCTHPSSLCFP